MKNEKGGTTMNVSTCLNILREIKDVAFATVDENNQPQVRIIDVLKIVNYIFVQQEEKIFINN